LGGSGHGGGIEYKVFCGRQEKEPKVKKSKKMKGAAKAKGSSARGKRNVSGRSALDRAGGRVGYGSLRSKGSKGK